jgi:hypothetical protein
MSIALPSICRKILVVGLPEEQTREKKFQRFQERGAIYSAVENIRLLRDIPQGIEAVAVYSPDEEGLDPLSLTERRRGNTRYHRIKELTDLRRVPCFFTSTQVSLESFLDSRLLGPDTLSLEPSESGDDVSHSQYVEARAPKGYNFPLIQTTADIAKQAEADGMIGLGPFVVRGYLTRLRDARKRFCGEQTNEPKEKESAPRLSQRELREAPDVTLPDDLIRAGQSEATRIDVFVSRLYRELPISDASYINAIYKLAVANGFEYAQKGTIYAIFVATRKRARERAQARANKEAETVASSAPSGV